MEKEKKEQAPQKKDAELFNKKGDDQKDQNQASSTQPQSKNIGDIINDINSLTRRIRMLEERYYNIRKKTQLTDQNMIEDNKKLITQIQNFSGNLKDLKKKIVEISEKLSMFDEEIKDTAKKSDLAVIDKYLEFWEPINFLTEKEAVLLINDVLDEVGLKKAE